MDWEEFVGKYAQSGHQVATYMMFANFTVPVSSSCKSNRKMPTVFELVQLTLGCRFTGDWAFMAEDISVRKTGDCAEAGVFHFGMSYNFIFQNEADALQAAAYLGCTERKLGASNSPHFQTMTTGAEMTGRTYRALVSKLGY
jgi:hypothetical protein